MVWLGTVVFAFICTAPWLWLILLAFFTAAVNTTFGHFPSDGRPDPRATGDVSILYYIIIMLLPVVLFSPVALGLYALVQRVFRTLPLDEHFIIAYVFGLMASGVVIFGDAFGLMNWLMG